MKVSTTLTLLSLLAVFTYSNAAETWSYSGDDGPSYWGEYNENCDGDHQSPIDVSSADAELDETMGDFDFTGYGDTSGTWTLLNNGHTIVVNLDESVTQTLTAGGLSKTYKAAQFHFHWGADDNHGSEHYINGESYPLELHIVHYFADDYADLTAAVESNVYDAVAVLGVMFEISDTENAEIGDIIDQLSHVEYASTNTTHLSPFALEDMLPSNVSFFARYNGSLTTPPCSETVQWTVFGEPVGITEEQMESMRSIAYENGEDYSGENEFIDDNYRPLQSIGDRVIKVTHAWNSGATLRPESALGMLLISALTFLLNRGY